MKLFRLRGGIHPEGRKTSSADAAIRALPLSPYLFVPLQQHVGAPAKPVVQVGDTVLAGQLIGAGQGNVSAPVHAPTSGRVVAIGDHPSPHPSGLSAATVTIEPDHEARWVDADLPADPFGLAPDEISERVGAAGIVGLGGATFPSSVKLKLSRRSGVDTLIINGGECEPYLTCDDRIMRERAADIVTGIRLIQFAVGARRALVGIEDNKPEALAAMRQAAAGNDVEIRMVPAMYPMGWDKQMIQVLLGREVPAEGRSADIGVLVHNVATAWAVQQTICLGRPLVSRIVTVSGGAVAAPANLEVPIGTPVQALFDACGGFHGAPARLVLGGPMMGHQLSHTSVPVVKGSSGVLALTQAEIGLTRPAPCIRCSTCVRACPVGLLPLEMAARIRSDDLAGAEAIGLKDCIACGSCSYVCPSSIPLVHYFNYAKGELMSQARSRLKQEATRKLAEERTARMQRIAREREEAAEARKAAKAAREAAAQAAAKTEVAA
ncbi:MAG: electron transport complex subunit RsxC [Thiobacillus sp.]|nr:electron transport complex subunit RsxC [Thiobacillus sp.]